MQIHSKNSLSCAREVGSAYNPFTFKRVTWVKVTQTARPGQVVMPHGFGLIFQGETYGPSVNRLTKNTHRDRLAGTPLHSYVRCRVSSAQDLINFMATMHPICIYGSNIRYTDKSVFFVQSIRENDAMCHVMTKF